MKSETKIRVGIALLVVGILEIFVAAFTLWRGIFSPSQTLVILGAILLAVAGMCLGLGILLLML